MTRLFLHCLTFCLVTFVVITIVEANSSNWLQRKLRKCRNYMCPLAKPIPPPKSMNRPEKLPCSITVLLNKIERKRSLEAKMQTLKQGQVKLGPNAFLTQYQAHLQAALEAEKEVQEAEKRFTESTNISERLQRRKQLTIAEKKAKRALVEYERMHANRAPKCEKTCCKLYTNYINRYGLNPYRCFVAFTNTFVGVPSLVAFSWDLWEHTWISFIPFMRSLQQNKLKPLVTQIIQRFKVTTSTLPPSTTVFLNWAVFYWFRRLFKVYMITLLFAGLLTCIFYHWQVQRKRKQLQGGEESLGTSSALAGTGSSDQVQSSPILTKVAKSLKGKQDKSLRGKPNAKEKADQQMKKVVVNSPGTTTVESPKEKKKKEGTTTMAKKERATPPNRVSPGPASSAVAAAVKQQAVPPKGGGGTKSPAIAAVKKTKL